MSLCLKDPRNFSTTFSESNILINQARYDLAHNEVKLRAVIEGILQQGEDQRLSVAYNLAPSAEIARYLWETLQVVLNSPPAPIYIKLFAIPVTIVVGSATAVEIPNQVEALALQDLFIQKKMFKANQGAIISGKLFDAKAVATITPAQIYHNRLNIDAVSSWINNLELSPIINQGEMVHLRFLLGAVLYEQEQETIVPTSLGMDLLALLSKSLAIPDATIFPLPFARCALSEAVQLGEFYHQEIALTVLLSNVVKRMRLEKGQPAVKVRTQPQQIIIEVYDLNHQKLGQQFYWQLHRADNFTRIGEILTDLFNDMQLPVSYTEEEDLYG